MLTGLAVLRCAVSCCMQAAARIVLQDWNEGRIPYYTLPPQERPNQEFETAEVVSSWAAEFDAYK
jgi:nuclear GTP-binding protein